MHQQTFSIPGVVLLTPEVFPDHRGFFLESFHKQRYKQQGLFAEFVQDNLSFSYHRTLRGMHFQTFPGQAKLITVLQGKIWDVFADIRPESPTYLQWGAIELSSNKLQQLLLPVGVAHGFCVLSEQALVQYKVSHHYNPQTEKSFRYDDPTFNISWPIDNPILSEKDKLAPCFKELAYV
jgi:dTDP-4-dehydrorhamnose 3,5-epimerase